MSFIEDEVLKYWIRCSNGDPVVPACLVGASYLTISSTAIAVYYGCLTKDAAISGTVDFRDFVRRFYGS